MIHKIIAISGIIKEMQLDRDVYKPKQVLSRIPTLK
jgi:DNA helicase-2/ATP-dependent DNA helicase PcrA